MGFINIWLLALTGLAVLPVVLHMMQKPTPKVEPFPTLRFLRIAQKRGARAHKLKHLLLLITRCLIILLLCLLFARPFLRETGVILPGSLFRVDVAFIVDDSLSSLVRDSGGRTRLELYKKNIDELVSRLEPGSRIFLFTTSGEGEIDGTTSPDLIKRGMEFLESSYRSGSPALAVNRAIDALDENEGSKSLIIFLTDRESTGLECPAVSKKENIPPIIFLDTVKGLPENRFLTDLEIPGTALFSGAVLKVKVKAESSKSSGKDAVVELRINGVKKEEKSVSMGQVIEFKTRVKDSGDGTISFRHEDDLPEDNKFSFSFQVRENSKVFVLNGAPSVVPAESESYYLRTALTTFVPGGMTPVDYTEGSGLPSNLSEYRHIFLLNPPDLQEGDLNRLRKFVRRGGSLFIFPGSRQILNNSLNKEFMRSGVYRSGFMPATLEKGVDKSLRLTTRGLSPFLRAIYVGKKSGGGKLDQAVFRQAFSLKVNSLDSFSSVLVWFENNTPAVVMKRYGRGRVVVAAFPADRDWSDFPIKDAFFTFIQTMMGAMEGSIGAGLNMSIDSPEEIIPPDFIRDWLGEAKSVTLSGVDNSGDELPPRQLGWELGNIHAGETTLFMLPKLKPGNYRLAAFGEGEKVVGIKEFSLNAKRDECKLRWLSEEEIKERFDGVEVLFAGEEDEVWTSVPSQVGKVEITRLLWLLFPPLILLELFLANILHKREPDIEEE